MLPPSAATTAQKKRSIYIMQNIVHPQSQVLFFQFFKQAFSYLESSSSHSTSEEKMSLSKALESEMLQWSCSVAKDWPFIMWHSGVKMCNGLNMKQGAA